MKKFCFLLLVLTAYLLGFSQTTVPYFGRIKWASGYSREINGETLGYTSAYPDYATTSLLTRCTNGSKVIEWETAPVPKTIKGDYVYFSWVAAHSSGTSSGIRNFDLYLNDEKLLAFTTYPAHQRPNWIFAAEDSSALVFQQTRRDGANDAHGLAFLRLPVTKVKPGVPVKLKIVGAPQNSNDWFMTFKFTFEEKVDILPMPFLLKDGKQTLSVTALHFGEDQALRIRINNTDVHSFLAKNGINRFDIPVRAVQKADSVFVQATLGKKVLLSRYLQLKPVQHRVLHFIHHSHTDIGYSHLQPDVLKIHIKNIDDALRMIDATKKYPIEARFKWNVESLWAVENYLQQASPEQKKRFREAVSEGSIGLSALYANILTGLSQPEEMFHYTDYADRLRHEFGFTINSAMISDVPGYAWATVAALASRGVRYFSSGPNYLGEHHPYGGDRVGYFVKTWGDKPVWWTSPSGEEKILFWTAGKGYSSWHGFTPGALLERGAGKVAAYLEELDSIKYPYEMVQWRYNCVADNGPIDTTVSVFVDQWNKKYASPKIVLNTTERMFAEFEQKYGASLPIVKGDITPYWEDGAISTAAEEGKNRRNSLRLQQITNLYSMLNPKKYAPEKFYQAWKDILLFHEHTWGAYNSISQPDSPFVTEQWRIKKQFMLDADDKINVLEQELLQPIRNAASRKIAVFNTLSWQRSGPVFLSPGITGKSVKDTRGRRFPLQKLSNGQSVFYALDVPPLGTALYEVSEEEATQFSGKVSITDSSIRNGKVWLTWDKNKGSILELKTSDQFNYAGSFNNQGLNSYWYVPGLDPAKAETNGNTQIAVLENGPVLTSIAISSEAPGALKLQRIISLYAESDEIEIENLVDKKSIRNKESVHFGFPFNTSFSNTTLDVGYGSMHYLKDQLPGSNMDFLYGRRWMDVSAADRGVQLKLMETPMIEPGSMIDERLVIQQSHKEWKKENYPASTWFSYAMNNYWHTNYKADQEGISRFRYALRPHGRFSYSQSEKSGAEFTQPLIALPIKEEVQVPGRLVELTNNRILITSITPQGKGSYLLRMYNPEPAAEKTEIIWHDLKPSQVTHVKTGARILSTTPVIVAGMGVLELKVVE